MKRRDFLTTSLSAAALATVSARAASSESSAQEYLELRVYRLKRDTEHGLLDTYLEKALVPALNRIGAKPVGAFMETEGKDDPAVYVLIPYPTLETFVRATTELPNDRQYQEAGAEYLGVSKANPNFVRIDSWLLRAFSGMPKVELPSYCQEKQPRIFEIRTYESYSEAKALKKVEMFNSGEIDVMHELKMGPIFFGQALIGPNLPHLTYMLSAETREGNKQYWSAFGKHPTWKKLSSDPQYADTVSKITNRFLAPTPYSQI